MVHNEKLFDKEHKNTYFKYNLNKYSDVLSLLQHHDIHDFGLDYFKRIYKIDKFHINVNGREFDTVSVIDTKSDIKYSFLFDHAMYYIRRKYWIIDTKYIRREKLNKINNFKKITT